MTKKELNEFLMSEAFKKKYPKNIFRRFIKQYIDIHYNPTVSALYLIRKMQYLHSQKSRIKKYFARRIQMKLIHKYGIFLGFTTKIKNGLHLPHPTSIVFGSSVELGENVTIYQNTTIGGLRTGDAKKKLHPVVGNNCTVFANSLVLGNIVLQDYTTVGANSLLTTDTEPNSIYAGSPAKRVK